MVHCFTNKVFYDDPVLTVAELPVSAPAGTIRFVISENSIYQFVSGEWQNIGTKGTGSFHADGSVLAKDNWNIAGNNLLNLGQLTSASGTGFSLLSRAVDGPTSIVFEIDTVNTISNSAARLLSLQVLGIEKCGINSSGGLIIAKGFTVGRIGATGDVSSNGEDIIGITDTTYPVQVTLSTSDLVDGRKIIVKDESGGANANNITIVSEDPYVTIDGNANEVIAIDYDYRAFYSDGQNWFTF